MKDSWRAHRRVAYDGEAKNLTVALSYGDAAAAQQIPCSGVLWFVSQWRKAGELADGDIFAEMGYDELADEEFFVESRPWRFRYSDARPHPTRAGRRHTFLLPRAPVTATPSSSPALRSPPHLPRPLRLAAARNGVGWGTRRPWWRRLDPGFGR
ncbi:hypothetical protein OsI_29465 [Oryza sativa Indica Group]|uniref:Uncharacterized protein n=1 Tax=Oryza sativa subsp. indica TaxID=39946 RepID=A2YVV9_ORYSI|nr:hypothetical protein OsI_29465 [Oryza sativa Indica Group]